MDIERRLLNCEMENLEKKKVIEIFNSKYREVFKDVKEVDNLFLNFKDFIISGKGAKRCIKSIVVYQLNLGDKTKWSMRFEKSIFLSKRECNSVKVEIDITH